MAELIRAGGRLVRQEERPALGEHATFRDYSDSVREQQLQELSAGYLGTQAQQRLAQAGQQLHVLAKHSLGEPLTVADQQVYDSMSASTRQSILNEIQSDQLREFLASNPDSARLFVDINQLDRGTHVVGSGALRRLSETQQMLERREAQTEALELRYERMSEQPEVYDRPRFRRTWQGVRQLPSALATAAHELDDSRMRLARLQVEVSELQERTAADQVNHLERVIGFLADQQAQAGVESGTGQPADVVRFYAGESENPVQAAIQLARLPGMAEARDRVYQMEQTRSAVGEQAVAYAGQQRQIERDQQLHQLYQEGARQVDEQSGRAELEILREQGRQLMGTISALQSSQAPQPFYSGNEVSRIITQPGGINQIAAGSLPDVLTSVAAIKGSDYSGISESVLNGIADPYAREQRRGLEVLAEYYKEQGRTQDLNSLVSAVQNDGLFQRRLGLDMADIVRLGDVGSRLTPTPEHAQVLALQQQLRAEEARLASLGTGPGGAAGQGGVIRGEGQVGLQQEPQQAMVHQLQVHSYNSRTGAWEFAAIQMKSEEYQLAQRLRSSGYQIVLGDGGTMSIAPLNGGNIVASTTLRGASTIEIEAQRKRFLQDFTDRLP